MNANGQGFGKGGNIIVAGFITSINGTFAANGGQTGNGGTIGIASSNNDPGQGLTINAPAGITALGGQSGGMGGGIIITSAGVLKVAANVTINASAQAAGGNGGNIQLTSGFLNGVPANGTLEIGGTVLANGPAGSISLAYSDVIGGLSKIQLDTTAVVRADAPSASTNAVNLTTNTSNALTVQNDAGSLLSAANGALNFQNPGQSVSVTESAGVPGGSLVGTVMANGTVVTISVTSTTDLSLGNIFAGSGVTANGAASISQAGTGNLTQQSGMTISAASLTLSTSTGNIGAISQSIQTAQVSSLTAQTSLAGQGSVYISNNASNGAQLVIQDNLKTGGAFSVQSTNAISVGMVMAGKDSTGTSISLIATSGKLLVRQLGFLTAGGNIVLQGGNALVVSANDAVATSGGSITLSVGRAAIPSCTETNPATPPACAPGTVDQTKVTITPPGVINWGSGLIATSNNFFDAVGQTITFDPNGLQLELRSGAVINARQ